MLHIAFDLEAAPKLLRVGFKRWACVDLVCVELLNITHDYPIISDLNDLFMAVSIYN